MKTNNFNKRYALTLHKDPHTEENYIKLPVVDLAELGYMQQAILDGLLYLVQIENRQEEKELQNSMYWLLKILLASYPQEELEGISEWLKS